MMFSPQFDKDFRAWKKTRPQYGELTKAIRDGKPHAEIMGLAFEAGIDAGEVQELLNLRRATASPEVRKRASEFGAAEKKVNALTEQILDCEKKAALAKTRLQSDEAENTAYNLTEERRKQNDILADASVAADRLDAAKAAGVL